MPTRIPWAPRERYELNSDIPRLILDAGQQQAEGHLRSGSIWANTAQQLGSIVGQAFERRGEEQRRAKEAERKAFQDATFVKMVETWDGKDPKALLGGLTKVLGREEGTKAAQAVMAFAKPAADQKQEVQNLGTVLSFAEKQTDEVMARWYPALRQRYAPTLQQLGMPPDALPPEWTPELRGPLGELAKAFGGAKGEESYTLTPGDKRFKGSTVVAENPKTPEGPKPETRGLEIQMADAAARGDKETYERLLKVRSDAAKADDKPLREGLTPTMESNVINRLTQQWGKAVAPVVELSRQVKLMDTGLDAARKGDLAQGAQAVLVTFQKILDPTSVVRESEYDRSAAGQALTTRIRGAMERLTKGGAGIPLDELEKFANLAREAAKAQSTGYVDAQKNRIGKTADRFKIPRELVFEDFDFQGALSPRGAAPAAGGAPKVGTVEDGYEFLGGDPSDRKNWKKK